MIARLSKVLRDRSGNTLLLPAIGATALIGGAGLSVDAVEWYLWKRQLQQAVDSAALAGGQSLRQGADSETSALRELKRNSDAKTTATRVANPPISGTFTGDEMAMEVVGSIQKPLPFSSLFLKRAPVIRARAVAATVVEGTHCVISLARDETGVSATGSASIDLGCGVATNSRDSDAIDLSGTSFLRASPLSAVGGISYDPKHIEAGTDMLAYTIPQIDPILSRGLAVPASPSGCTANKLTVNPNESISIGPGRYCNGITVRGDLEMAPGIYIIDRGELKVNSQAVIRGEAVTIVLTGSAPGNVATIDFEGGATVDLRAPSLEENANWFGILIFQNRNSEISNHKLAGNSEFNMQGVVYLPKGNIRFTGSSGQHSQCLLLVVNRVTFQGDSSFDDDCPEALDSVDMGARRVKIVE